jgi:hypothetical protein
MPEQQQQSSHVLLELHRQLLQSLHREVSLFEYILDAIILTILFRRFPDYIFDMNVVDWECPRCNDCCACDKCTRDRGETYVTMRGTGSRKALGANREAIRELTPTPPPPSPTIPDGLPGSSWGIVYGVGKDAIAVIDESGLGIVPNKFSAHVMARYGEMDNGPVDLTYEHADYWDEGMAVSPVPPLELAQPTPDRRYIGVPLPQWGIIERSPSPPPPPGIRRYIGNRATLDDPAWSQRRWPTPSLDHADTQAAQISTAPASDLSIARATRATTIIRREDSNKFVVRYTPQLENLEPVNPVIKVAPPRSQSGSLSPLTDLSDSSSSSEDEETKKGGQQELGEWPGEIKLDFDPDVIRSVCMAALNAAQGTLDSVPTI